MGTASVGEGRHRKLMPRLCSLVIFTILFFGYAITSEAATLTILHTNDVHGVFRGADLAGEIKTKPAQGLLRIGTIAGKIKSENPNTLIIDAGDALHGTAMVYTLLGEPVTEIMNAVGYDYRALGNHDYEWGLAALEEHVKRSGCPFLAANVSFPEGYDFSGVKPYVIKEIAGVRIAVIGLLTTETLDLLWPGYAEGLKIEKPEPVLKRILKDISGKADFVLLISHLGLSRDMKLASEISGVDLILGGHSHDATQEAVRIGGTVIANSGAQGEFLGRADIDFETPASGQVRINDISYDLIPVDDSYQESMELTSIYEPYRAAVDESLDRVVAESWIDMSGEDSRIRETRLGNMLADMLRSAAGAQAALIDAGTIGGGLKEGNVTIRQLYSTLSAYTRQNVVVGFLSGAQLKETLELAASDAKKTFKLQVSGVTFGIDTTANQGNRIFDVLVGNKPLDENAIYSVVSTGHLYMGASGFKNLKQANETVNLGRPLRDVVISQALKERFIWPDAAGRVRIYP